MRINCPGCGGLLPVSEQTKGKKIQCGKCNAIVAVPADYAGTPVNKPFPVAMPVKRDAQSSTAAKSSSAVPPLPTVPSITSAPDLGQTQYTPTPYPARSRKQGREPVSNRAIITTAVCCVVGLLVLGGIALVMNHIGNELPNTAESSSETDLSNVDADPATRKVNFDEGYSMMLPSEFADESREETSQGHVVYRFRTEEGYRFIVAVLGGEPKSRFDPPPDVFSKTVVKSIPGLDQGADSQLQAQRKSVGGMPANVFQFFERETFRGVNFTYVMVAMDNGKKIVLKFSGKYGGFDTDEVDIEMPTHWETSLLTLRRANRN